MAISVVSLPFGLPNLRAIMIATEFFDINEGDLPNGGKRTICRISKRFQLTLPDQSELQPN